MKKTQEYRIHVFDGQVIFVQRKARRLDTPDDQVNWQVRNHSNGFIYANQNIEVDQEAKDMSVRAVQALGLDFAAVDIIYHKDYGYCILELNTAPGLTQTTANKYAEAIYNFVERKKNERNA